MRKKKEKKKKKVGENNGQLRFFSHNGWRTQAHLDQKKERAKVGDNTQARMAHASRLGQNLGNFLKLTDTKYRCSIFIQSFKFETNIKLE